MTGFGRGGGGDGPQEEVRSVNHRYAEVVCRLPRELSGLEGRIKERLRRHLRRGRVEVTVGRWLTPGGARLVVDTEGLKEAVGVLRLAKEALEVEGEVDLPLLLAFREFFAVESEPVEDEVAWGELQPALDAALAEWDRARRHEGAALAADLLRRVARLEGLVAEVEAEAEGVRQELAARIRERVAELGVEVEPGRLEQEVALLAMRADVQEEITRLRAHLAAFRRGLEGDGPVGRRLEFLCQEMGREINTIGSKSARLTITERVVALKEALDPVREQVQNLE